MNTKLSTYSADEVDVIFAGVRLEGFADGEFVTVERRSDTFALKVGADGESAGSNTNDRSGSIKVKLLQTSLGNSHLSQMHTLDQNGPNGAGIGTLAIVDRSSGITLARADHAWVLKPGAASRGKEITEVEWTLETNNLEMDVSGAPAI
jgi:hypothetical protein